MSNPNQTMSPYSELQKWAQWVLWIHVDGVKKPCNPHTGSVANAHDPQIWMSWDDITVALTQFPNHKPAFVLTENDPFFLLDLDHCEVNGEWTKGAISVLDMVPGALIEVSNSGTGLHAVAKYKYPIEHGTRNKANRMELYSKKRVYAIGDMTTAMGCSGTEIDIKPLVDMYFPARVGVDVPWSNEPVPEWNGITDDDRLIDKMMASRGAGVFGGKATIRDLWENDETVLAMCYPPQNDRDPYDRSSADAALASHLAFWTGKNHKRVWELMWRSKLVRDKWNSHKNYLHMTVSNAIARCTKVYGQAMGLTAGVLGSEVSATDLVDNLSALDDMDVDGLKAVLLAAEKLDALHRDQVFQAAKKQKTRFGVSARTIDTIKPGSAIEIPEDVSPVKVPQTIGEVINRYIWLRSEDRWFDRFTGLVVTSTSLNMTYGHLAEGAQSLERVLREQPRLHEADARTFIPGDYRELVSDAAMTRLNMWRPQGIPPMEGDTTHWIELIEYLVPDRDQREHLLDWMAFSLQHQSVKINHALVIGGTPRAGKDTIFEPLRRGIGTRYCNDVNGSKLNEQYEDWAVEKKLVSFQEARFTGPEVEDRLKTFTASPPTTLNLRRLGRPDLEQPNLLAIVLFTNRKNGVTLGSDPSRYFCVWCDSPVIDGDYYKRLWNWYEDGGCAYVVDYLMKRDVSSFNPKSGAPDTLWGNELKGVAKSDDRVMIEELIEDCEREILSMDEIKSQLRQREGRSPGSQAVAAILRELGADYREVKGSPDQATGKRKKYRLWILRRTDHWSSVGDLELVNAFNERGWSRDVPGASPCSPHDIAHVGTPQAQ